MSEVFQNLTDEEVMRMYEELSEKGYSEDDIFDIIYQRDCILDYENENDWI